MPLTESRLWLRLRKRKRQMWLLKWHMQWTHRRTVLMKAVMTAACLDPLHYKVTWSKTHRTTTPEKGIVIKWHFGCTQTYFWVILLLRDQLQPEQPLRMNPILPQQCSQLLLQCWSGWGLCLLTSYSAPFCNPSSRKKRAIWFCIRQYLLQLLWNWNPGKAFQQETAAFIPKLVFW